MQNKIQSLYAFVTALCVVAFAAAGPWALQYFSFAKMAAVEENSSQIADLAWIEPGLLRYYIEFDRLPDSLDKLVPEQPGVQFKSMPSYEANAGIDLGQIPQSLENGTAKYVVSPDGNEYVLWTEVSGDKERYLQMSRQLDPRDRDGAEGTYLGINCSEKKIFCLHGTVQDLLETSQTQVVRAAGYKIYVAGSHGAPNLYPRVLLIVPQPEAGAQYFVVDDDSGLVSDLHEVCSYWADDPYCKNHYTIELSYGFKSVGTYTLKIVKSVRGKQTTIGTAQVVVTTNAATNSNIHIAPIAPSQNQSPQTSALPAAETKTKPAPTKESVESMRAKIEMLISNGNDVWNLLLMHVVKYEEGNRDSVPRVKAFVDKWGEDIAQMETMRRVYINAGDTLGAEDLNIMLTKITAILNNKSSIISDFNSLPVEELDRL